MKISVALCTYNGAEYLQQQLDSIAAQSRQPDELVVCDDRSTDASADIARKFAASAAFPVSVRVNDANLGSTSNFAGAIELCTGDIIVLSDQDDVWLPEKLARIEAEFDSHPKTGLVFSDAIITDAGLRPIGASLWREMFRRYDREMFANGRAAEVLLQHNVVTGATLAFRSALREAILPIPKLDDYIHDAWISLIAALSSETRSIPRPLIMYRQHSSQQLGAGLSGWKIPRIEHHRMRIDDRNAAHERIKDFQRIFDQDRLELLRSVAPDPRSVPSISDMGRLLDNAKLSIERNIEHITPHGPNCR